ncbi:girdin-like [Tachysurus vachellii]|uniref:girdin-like n=1 Tax=Tachysurus vachellii TaxID=175792 RepID=UPI00296AF486|nr:girdin-like [Tachysurus vachellii]
MDPSSLFLEAGVCSNDPEDPLYGLEGMYKKVMELKSELNINTSYMAVREEPGEHFSQNQKGYRYLRRKHKKVAQAHKNMKVHYSRMERKYNELLKEREQEKLCLAQAMESRARIENENIDLLSQMSTLRCSMHQLKQELTEAQRIFAGKNKQVQDLGAETFKTLELGPNLTHNEEILVTSLTEIQSKLRNVTKINFMLDQERVNLCDQVCVLRHSVKELEEMLSDSERKYDAVKQENEQLMQVHNILKMRYKRMLESVTQCNTFLMNYYKEDEVVLL